MGQGSGEGYIVSNKLKNERGIEHVSGVGERRDAYWVLVGKLEGKRQLGRPRLKWEDNITINL
jgi:hypothetical protein